MDVDFAKNKVIQKKNDRIRNGDRQAQISAFLIRYGGESSVGAENTACGTWRRRGEGEEEEGGGCASVAAVETVS